MDRLQEVELALSADLLRASLLGAPAPVVGDRYVVQKYLGRGASGVVVAAEDVRLRRRVALKLSLAGAGADNLSEARALAALDHRNVVRVYDVGVVDATFEGKRFRLSLVCMQYVEGCTLRAWLAGEQRSLQEVLDVFIAAGRGLAAAHAAKLVHRDFKPENVLVGSDGVAQVIDFGFVADTVSQGWADGALPPVAGTLAYMAPEARLGRVTRRGDQYSFGVSLVEALTGEPRRAAGAPPREVPKGVWRALVRATSVDPDERFADMDALLDALALGSKSNPSRSRSRFSLLGGTAVVALVGMAGIATVSHRRGDASAPAGVASPPVYLMTDAATFDATADADVVTEATALDAGSVVDASVPDLGFAAAEAPTQPAQRTCPDLAGTYDLTTERTKGGRRSDTTYGRYRLILSVAGPGLRAQVTKTGSSDVLPVRRNLADNLERERVTRGDECAVEVVAGHGDRTYTFSLTFDGDVGHGTFVAEGDRRRGTYGGMVRIQKVLQQ